MDRYFADNPKHEKKIRAQIDRPELYAYESQIGKQLVDMTPDELLDMVASFRSHRFDSDSYTVYGSYRHIASLYRSVFDWYINNIEVIINPWNRRDMRGAPAINRLAERSSTVITMDTVNDIISRLHDDLDQDRADYVECIMRLFICGFATAEEIVLMRESDVDFRESIVSVRGKKVSLDNRAMELLMKVDSLDNLPAVRGKYVMARWHEYYFKYPVRDSKSMDAYDRLYVGRIINKQLLQYVCTPYKIDLNYYKLYYLGFYHFLIKTYGEEKTREYVTSERSTEAAEAIFVAARLYGIERKNVTCIKNSLRPYVV